MPPTAITAAQVIYTNVEVEQSPTGNRGFQTVFYTTDRISREILETEIEPALQYFPRSNFGPKDSPAELLFFTLSTGQVVVGQITPLLTEVDKFNRKKMLFAHVLVFDGPEFRRVLDNNPFAVIDANPFARSYDDLMAAGHVIPTKINIPSTTVTAAISDTESDLRNLPRQLCTVEGLRTLLLMASAAATPKREADCLQIRGNPVVFLDFMRMLFALVPPAFRTACSFDTSYVSDTGQAKTAMARRWANGVGEGQKIKDDSAIIIDLQNGTAELDGTRFQPLTPFEQWFAEVSRQTDFVLNPQTIPRVHAASSLQELLWGQIDSLPCDVDDELFRGFLAVNSEYIRRLLQKNFAKYPGAGFAEELTAHALNWVGAAGPSALSNVPRRFSDDRICEWLVPRLEGHPTRKLNSEEVTALGQVAKSLKTRSGKLSANERLVCIVFHRWAHNPEELKQLLTTDSEDQFVRHAKWLLLSLSTKISRWAYLRQAMGLFFGFGAEEQGTVSLEILRALTCDGPDVKNIGSHHVLDVGFRRKVTLELMWKMFRGPSASKSERTPRPVEDRVQELHEAERDRPQGRETGRPGNVAPAAVLYSGQIFVSQRLPQLSKQQTEFLLDSFEAMRGSQGSQIAFFKWGAHVVIVLTQADSSIPCGWMWLLGAQTFAEYENNPFVFLRSQPALADFLEPLLSGSPEDLPLISKQLPAIQRFLLLISQRRKVGIRGTGPTVARTLEQVFAFVPVAARLSCTFFTGCLPEKSPFDTWLTGCQAESEQNTPVYDPMTFVMKGFPDIKPTNPYEVCMKGAPRHKLWDDIWPREQNVFDWFDVLSRLKQHDQHAAVADQISTDQTMREGEVEANADVPVSIGIAFLELNGIHKTLLHIVEEDFGSHLANVLSPSLRTWSEQNVYRALKSLHTGVSPSVMLQLAAETLNSTMTAVPGPELLGDLKELSARTAGDNARDAVWLRLMLAAFNRDWGKLSFLIEKLEPRDDGDELFRTLSQKLLTLFPSAEWEFICDAETDFGSVVGVQVNLPNNKSKPDSESVQLLGSLFGVRNLEDITTKPEETQLELDVDGRFWPSLAACLQRSLESSKVRPDA